MATSPQPEASDHSGVLSAGLDQVEDVVDVHVRDDDGGERPEVGVTAQLLQRSRTQIEHERGSLRLHQQAGAAHPNSYTEVVNFDLKNGKQLRLADIFLPGSKFLGTLSNYCIQDLKKQSKAQGADGMLDDDWIQKGAGPDLANYNSWSITKKGLAVTFDPYQVGPYAAGPQHVLVPYSAVKDIIKPDGPAGQFAKQGL